MLNSCEISLLRSSSHLFRGYVPKRLFFNASSILTIVLEMFVLALVYLGLSKLLHFEAFYYLVITARDYLGAKRK